MKPTAKIQDGDLVLWANGLHLRLPISEAIQLCAAIEECLGKALKDAHEAGRAYRKTGE